MRTQATHAVLARSDFILEESEPTAFAYAYMALNGVYTYNWETVTTCDEFIADSETLTEREERTEEDKLKAFVRFVLRDDWAQTQAWERARVIEDGMGNPAPTVLSGLGPLGGADENLDSQALCAARRLSSEAMPPRVQDDFVQVLKAAYELRSNLFHGRKHIATMIPKQDRYARIGVFRQYVLVVLDVFLLRLHRIDSTWNPYFEGYLVDALSLRQRATLGHAQPPHG